MPKQTHMSSRTLFPSLARLCCQFRRLEVQLTTEVQTTPLASHSPECLFPSSYLHVYMSLHLDIVHYFFTFHFTSLTFCYSHLTSL
jgi:hypothetical protein